MVIWLLVTWTRMKRKTWNSSSDFLLMCELRIGRELQLTYPLGQILLGAPKIFHPPLLPKEINNNCSLGHLQAPIVSECEGWGKQIGIRVRTSYDPGHVVFSSSRVLKVVNGPYTELLKEMAVNVAALFLLPCTLKEWNGFKSVYLRKSCKPSHTTSRWSGVLCMNQMRARFLVETDNVWTFTTLT